jgi:hypothetical protein
LLPDPVTADDAPVPCPSFAELGARLDREIASLKPGTPLRDFTRDFASQALNFERPTSPEGALFIVGVSEGNATVTDELQCRFDAGERLVSCHRECCRDSIRQITPEQYESLAQGETREEVERRLCSPSDTERQGADRISTYYHIALPIGHHDEGQTVLLVFERGKLVFMGMSPYY